MECENSNLFAKSTLLFPFKKEKAWRLMKAQDASETGLDFLM